MTKATLADLQTSVQDRSAFASIDDYHTVCAGFLKFIERVQPTRVISPAHHNYVFYQYDESFSYKITRPLNIDLFIESARELGAAFERFTAFLADLKRYKDLKPA
jgi:hypothetical protein